MTTARPSDGIRARNRAALEAEILRAARQQLAAHGAAALSVRAVAREVGMVSSAIYRYVPSRDELLTLLIIDAYDALGDAVDDALGKLDEATPTLERFAAIGRTMRRWALDHPHQHALLYGSPVPDYHAPAERTTGPGTRVQARMVRLLTDLGPSTAGAVPGAEAALGPALADPIFEDGSLTASELARGLAAWTLVVGAISTEVFGQFGRDTVADPDAYFDGVLSLAGELLSPPRAGPPARPLSPPSPDRASRRRR